ncbi:MAG: bifunctional diguanylate cyclase/phosphodiesterase [Erythrobacter sp.]
MAALTLVFAVILLAVVVSDQVRLLSPAPLLIAGALIYAATLVILGRDGLARLRDLETFGNTDSLSNLPNRRALNRMISKASRANQEVSLALIDLDGFKQVNDRFGHAVGDEVLAECANIIRSTCGDEAGCYRVGGDEFAAVMAGPAAGTILEGICRSLLTELSNPIQFGERHIGVGASIGLARSTSADRLSSSELLRRSDVAMYMSKRGGRGRCTWFNRTFDQRREAVRELEEEMRRGIANDEFVLAYQPLVNADTRDIVAVESLLRWNRQDGRNIGPNVFIPVAEESGLINTIGLWVLRQAISDALDWDDIILSVNISAAQLRNPAFPVQLGELLEETGFEPQRLELEITETCLVLDPIVAERTLDLIRGFGVHVALDDFGTGYASIGFLRQFRFEKLKLDRSLVAQAEEDDGSRAMMLSSIAMARALKMAVTAEGVETNEQADMVRLAGCDQMQGWLFHKAEPAATITELLIDQHSRLNSTANENTSAG